MAEGSGLLAGKNCLVMGVANRWSIAYAIGEALQAHGATLIVSYLDERMKKDAEALVAGHPESKLYPCNVESDEEIAALVEGLKKDYGRIDTLVHSIAFAPAQELKGRFIETSREGFATAMSVSVHSLTEVSEAVLPMMPEGSSIMALTYLGADRAFPRYNVMGVAKAGLESAVRYLAYDLGPQGIRVNAISAGPIKTASARGIPGFSDMSGLFEDRAPLKRPFGAKDVGGVAVFLASDLSAGVTGETIFVDNGYHAVGM